MMAAFKKILGSILLLGLVVMIGCNRSMVIDRVDYSQPIESVLTPNEDGIVDDVQMGLQFSILPLQYEETQDTSSVTVEQVRYIRGHEGYYYVTASDFKNVYIMSPDKGQLVVEEKIMVSEEGIPSPAFNQRDTYIQLLDRESGDSWQLTADGIQEEESQTENSNGE